MLRIRRDYTMLGLRKRLCYAYMYAYIDAHSMPHPGRYRDSPLGSPFLHHPHSYSSAPSTSSPHSLRRGHGFWARGLRGNLRVS